MFVSFGKYDLHHIIHLLIRFICLILEVLHHSRYHIVDATQLMLEIIDIFPDMQLKKVTINLDYHGINM